MLLLRAPDPGGSEPGQGGGAAPAGGWRGGAGVSAELSRPRPSLFGDIRDPHSRVAQMTQNERGYRVLDAHINTQPAVTYSKKVTFHEVESGEHYPSGELRSRETTNGDGIERKRTRSPDPSGRRVLRAGQSGHPEDPLPTGEGLVGPFLRGCLGVGLFFTCWIYQIVTGIGVSGLMSPVGWGVYITTFVFWVGIAHSGTLISAILFLFRAPWRQIHLPGGGGHDGLRRHDGGALPSHPSWAGFGTATG